MAHGTPAGEPKEAARGKYAPVRMDENDSLRRGLDTFAEHGYAATTVRELAKRLDVSHNFITVRYGSKWNFWRTSKPCSRAHAMSTASAGPSRRGG